MRRFMSRQHCVRSRQLLYREFRFPLEKAKSEMGKAGYKLAARHDFLPRQFLIFEVAGPSSR
jgi:hypothetical protein